MDGGVLPWLFVDVHVLFPDGLVARVDGVLGPGQSRSDWIRRAVERALGETPLPIDRRVPVSPAPAEQPEKEPEAEAAADVAEYREILDADPGDSRRSVREFRPYPKGG